MFSLTRFGDCAQITVLLEDPVNFLTDVLRCFFRTSKKFTLTSLRHDAATLVLHSRDAVLRILSLARFFPLHIDIFVSFEITSLQQASDQVQVAGSLVTISE